MKTVGSTKALFAAALIAALGVFASPATAQRADDMKGGGGNPCAPDAQRICGQFIPDRGKVASCLFKNKSQVSAACQAELGGGGKKATKSRKAKLHGKRSRRH